MPRWKPQREESTSLAQERAPDREVICLDETEGAKEWARLYCDGTRPSGG